MAPWSQHRPRLSPAQARRSRIYGLDRDIRDGDAPFVRIGELARDLTGHGVRVTRLTALPDDLAAVTEAFRGGLERADLVVSTGGLGPTPDDLTRDLGLKWQMLDTAMKPYSACKCTHASIQALLELMQENGFKVADIERVSFDESTINWLTVCIPEEVKFNPQTVPECQFSLPYVVATAALGYEVLPAAYAPAARARSDVREFMSKISAVEDPGLPIYTARAHVFLRDGRSFSQDCLYIKGHPRNPFTLPELIRKFRQCVPYSAYKLEESTVQSLLDSMLNLEKVDDITRALIIPITPDAY